MVKERDRPTNFRENQHDDLEDDEQSVNNSPENSCSLVRNSRVSADSSAQHKSWIAGHSLDVITMLQQTRGGVTRSLSL